MIRRCFEVDALDTRAMHADPIAALGARDPCENCGLGHADAIRRGENPRGWRAMRLVSCFGVVQRAMDN